MEIDATATQQTRARYSRL